MLELIELLFRHPLRPLLFPYTTLFRSRSVVQNARSPGFASFAHNVCVQLPASRMCRLLIPTICKRPRQLSRKIDRERLDRKSTRLNSSHSQISYAVFCLKKTISCIC